MSFRYHIKTSGVVKYQTAECNQIEIQWAVESHDNEIILEYQRTFVRKLIRI